MVVEGHVIKALNYVVNLKIEIPRISKRHEAAFTAKDPSALKTESTLDARIIVIIRYM